MSELLAPISPALLLSALIGALHACLYVLLRGRLRLHVLLIVPAAVLGAWVGQAVGARLGDPFQFGDFGLAWASGLSWAGILLVAVVSTLVSSRGPREIEEP